MPAKGKVSRPKNELVGEREGRSYFLLNCLSNSSSSLNTAEGSDLAVKSLREARGEEERFRLLCLLPAGLLLSLLLLLRLADLLSVRFRLDRPESRPRGLGLGLRLEL